MQDFDNNSPYTEEEAARMLRDVTEAYYFAVSAAEKFNALTAAHKHQLEKAIDRAADLGKVVDTLGKIVKDEL
ncbi:MAG TPA: hypothetical protein PKD52_07740 [Clostridiales bacterium]|nr:hypothetical protein [Clostridiales bacterium]